LGIEPTGLPARSATSRRAADLRTRPTIALSTGGDTTAGTARSPPLTSLTAGSARAATAGQATLRAITTGTSCRGLAAVATRTARTSQRATIATPAAVAA